MANNINRDNRIEIPETWMPMINTKAGERYSSRMLREQTLSRIMEDQNTPITAYLCDTNGAT